MSKLRARSISRSRVVKTSDVFPSGEVLDPTALLGDLLNKITDLDAPLAVKVSDNSNSVTYKLSVFVAKEYEVIGDSVKFGIRKLKIKELKVNISFDVELQDDSKEPG